MDGQVHNRLVRGVLMQSLRLLYFIFPLTSYVGLCLFIFTNDNSGDLCLIKYGPTHGLEENPNGDQDQGSDVICQDFSPFACSSMICRAFMYN